MRQFSTLFKQTQTLMNTQSSFFYMANFFISRFRSSSFTQHGPRQQQQHRPQPVSTKMIAMAISIGAQLKKKEMSQIKKLQLKTPDLCFPQALNVLRIRRDSLKFKHNIPPRPNDLLKPRHSSLRQMGEDRTILYWPWLAGPFTFIFLSLNKGITARTFLVEIQIEI